MVSVNLCYLPNELVIVTSRQGGKGFAKQDFSALT